MVQLSGTKAIEAGFEEESANNGKPTGITGSAGSTVKVTIEGLPSNFKCVMEGMTWIVMRGGKLLITIGHKILYGFQVELALM